MPGIRDCGGSYEECGTCGRPVPRDCPCDESKCVNNANAPVRPPVLRTSDREAGGSPKAR